MAIINYKLKTYSYEEIKKGDFSQEQTLSFCSEWLNQKQTFIVNTSGSTGKPKPIEISRNQMLQSAKMTIEALDLKNCTKSLVCLNTEFIAGKMMLVRSLELMMDITIVPPSSNPLKSFPNNAEFDFAALVPLQLETIFRESPDKIIILDNMKAIIVGGADINPYLENKIKLIKAPVYHTFGMTETISHIALKRLNGEDKSEYFKTLKGVTIALDKRECLIIKSPINKGAINTNDIVEIKNSIYFKWIGRIDNVINSGGIKVHPESIENIISKIFFSLRLNNRFFIAGLPNPQLGQIVSLIIEGYVGDNSIQEKIKFELLKALHKYEIPKNIYFTESFKETPTGKIDRINTLKLIQ